ncbi:MAG: hypothetical protein ABDI19_04035 [Armatimonadota bacterium]
MKLIPKASELARKRMPYYRRRGRRRYEYALRRVGGDADATNAPCVVSAGTPTLRTHPA